MIVTPTTCSGIATNAYERSVSENVENRVSCRVVHSHEGNETSESDGEQMSSYNW